MTNQTNAHTISALTAVEPTIDLAIKTFLDLALLGKKGNTVAWYRKRLGSLAEWLGQDNLISGVMDADLLTWLSNLEHRSTRCWGGNSTHPVQDGPLSPAYRHGFVRAARFFFKWLTLKKIILDNPALEMEFPRLPKTGRKGIQDSDAKKMLDLAKKGFQDGNQLRDFALLKFLETTGARLGGITNLMISDLNMDQEEPLRRRAIVKEKGDKERAVFMTPAATEALARWLAVRPTMIDEHVFVGFSQHAWRPLTGSGIYGIVKRYARAAGVARNWSPHQWRHRFGRKLAEKGVSLGVIAQIMGHEDVSITVNFYGKFAVNELQAMYDARMPDAD